MKKTLLLFVSLLFFSLTNAQTSLKRVGATSSKSTKVANAESSNTNVTIPHNTICFEEKENAEALVMNKTNYICSIKKFSTAGDAESFAIIFKKSDSNIANCSYIENKNGFFFFNFSVIKPMTTKWYLQLFQKNDIEFIKYNSEVKSIKELLSQ